MNSPAQIMERLAAIEADLANRQNEFAQAAGRKARLVREVDYAEAVEQVKAKNAGAGVTEAKAIALTVIGDTQDYKDLTAAEATYAASKAAIGVMESRMSVGQTLLKTLRESA